MKLLDRLESLVRRFAVPNLTAKLIIAQVFFFFVYVLRLQQGPGGHPLGMFELDLDAVVAGEVWRLVTFLIIPPVPPSLNWTLVFLLFYWSLLHTFGTALEHEWGVARYNLYVLIGYVATMVAATIAWLVWGVGYVGSNGFLYGSVFLAFARYFPDYTMYIFFVLPMKAKWLAWIQAAWYVMTLLFGSNLARLIVIGSVLNYLLYFGRQHIRDARQHKRSQDYRARTKAASKPIAHECRVCGLTSQMSPKTLFRYCSQCEGQACYCPEHIGDHEHVGSESSADSEA